VALRARCGRKSTFEIGAEKVNIWAMPILEFSVYLAQQTLASN